MSADVIHFPVPPTRLALRLERFAQGSSVLLAIWAVYFGLRVAVLFADVAPGSEGMWFDAQARALAEGHGFLNAAGQPTALRPIGWPLALSLVYARFGAGALALGLFNLASAMITGALTLLLGRRIFGNEAAARAALLLLALYPGAIAQIPLARSDAFLTALTLLVIWLLVARTSRWHLASAGVVLGLATLVKPESILLAPVLLAFEWVCRARSWARLRALVLDAILVLAVAALTIAPWTLRNAVQLHAFVPVSTQGGFALLAANHPGADGGYAPHLPALQKIVARQDLSEAARSAFAARTASAWIAQNPGDVLALAPRKIARLWSPDRAALAPFRTRFAPLNAALRLVDASYYLVLVLAFLLAAPALFAHRRRNGERGIGIGLLPQALALSPVLAALVFAGDPRAHVPFMPLVCLGAGWLAVAIWQRLAERRRPLRG